MTRDIETAAQDAQAVLFREFYEESTGLIYDYRDPERLKNLPTSAEIAAEIPYPTGWAGGTSNSRRRRSG